LLPNLKYAEVASADQSGLGTAAFPSQAGARDDVRAEKRDGQTRASAVLCGDGRAAELLALVARVHTGRVDICSTRLSCSALHGTDCSVRTAR
jgi:hypothetical protein